MTKAVQFILLIFLITPVSAEALTNENIYISTTGSGSINNTTTSEVFGGSDDSSASVFVRNIVGDGTESVEVDIKTTGYGEVFQESVQGSFGSKNPADTNATVVIDEEEGSEVPVVSNAFRGWFEEVLSSWGNFLKSFWN